MESKEDRLRRFQNGSPVEIIDTLLNSIDNLLNRQIEHAASLACWDLTILGIHAIALTISEALFNTRGRTGYRLFLERFVDRDEPGRSYSAIADDIHNWRNVIAHQWLAQSGHDIVFDASMDLGWKRDRSTLHFNPKLYTADYITAFDAGGKIWDWQDLLTVEQAEAAKNRLIDKYLAS